MASTRSFDALLDLARRLHVNGLHTEPVPSLSVPQQRRFVFRAVIFTSSKCKGFVGFGEADPSTIPPELRGCELRVAETRAISRALRRASSLAARGKDGTTEARPRLGAAKPVRERFQHLAKSLGITPDLLKAYAQVYCETQSLRAAGPERLTSFLDHIEDQARRDRGRLLTLIAQHAPTGGTQ